MLALALKLLIAHVIGDFVFQPYKWVLDKLKFKHRSKYLYYHIGVHLIALLVCTEFEWHYLPIIGIVIVTHYLIDLTKLNLDGKYNTAVLFLLDQAAHIGVILGVASWYSDFIPHPPIFVSSNHLLLILALLTLIFVARILMHLMMGKWSPDYGTNESIQRIGTFVGISERLLVFVFLINGLWLYIGILFVVKSLLRMFVFKPTDEHVRFDLFFIGSVFSFGMSILVGWGYLHYLSA